MSRVSCAAPSRISPADIMNSVQGSSRGVRLVSDCMWSSVVGSKPVLGGEEDLDFFLHLLAEQEDDANDSGIASNPSAGHSRSSSECFSSFSDEWTERTVVQSELFPPCGICPMLNIWSPTNEDDYILQQLVQSPSSSASSIQCISSSLESISSPSPRDHLNSSSPISTWESDSYEWGAFGGWSPMPSPAEADILEQRQKEDDERMHVEAALKRAAKKATFFAKLVSRRLKSSI